MEENEAETNSVRSADIHVCVFPNLNRLMAIDVRTGRTPETKVIGAQDLLTEEYYREVEEAFSQALRGAPPSFLHLIGLPDVVRQLLQNAGVGRLSQVITGEADGADSNRYSFFICAGPVLSMTDEEVDGALSSFFESAYPPKFVEEASATFKRLLEEEKGLVGEKQRDELRRAVAGDSEQFYTLWQDRPGESE